MPPKKPPQTGRNSTAAKHKASQAGKGPTAKTPRSTPSTITHTIHQQVNEQSSMVAGASLWGSPSVSSAHPIRVQHSGSHTPSPGYGLPLANQSPAQWWDP